MNRWGILAEAIAFVLVAPEIIGIERLRRAEMGLEEWLRGALQYPSIALGRGGRVPVMPGFAPGVAAWFFGLAWATTSGIVCGVFLLLWFGVSAEAAIFFVVAFSAGTVMVWIGFLLMLSASRLASSIGFILAIPFIPVLWAIAAIVNGMSCLLRGLIRAATQLLAGPDRLRVLVFGTGVVLLFGGMGAQFAATF